MLKKCFLAALLVSCTGCLTNNYEKFYVAFAEVHNIESTHGDAPVILKTVTTEDDVLDLIEEGYVPSGTSAFTGPYTPFSCAVDTAEKHGAALVLLDVRFRETQQYTSVMYLPSYSTTYGCGKTFHTTTMNAVPVRCDIDVYDHDAMFFKKVDVSKIYGALWHMPNRLPTEGEDAPVQVRVKAVFHGSRAEMQGIRRGQIVKSINGVAIRTRKDIAPFIADENLIKEMVVEDVR